MKLHRVVEFALLFAVAIHLPSNRANAQKDWTSASKPGDGSVFTFRGSKIGDPLEAKFQGYSVGYKDLKTPYCTGSGDEITCDEKELRSDPVAAKYNFPPHLQTPAIGDVQPLMIEYKYLRRSLYGFMVVFNTGATATMLTMLEGKYGKPNSQRIEMVHNRMGAAFDNIVAVWNTPHGPMTLQSRYGSIDNGLLELTDAKIAAMLDASKKASTTAKGKSAF
jgi:hypothetical protein